MANHISAAKRHRQSEKQRIRNRSIKSALNTKIKKIKLNIGIESARLGQSVLASAARMGVLHRNTAARRISRLVKNLNQNLA